MAEKHEGMVIVGGVRYRHEDAVRLGLVPKKAAPKKAEAVKEEVAEDAGTVSGEPGGSGNPDEVASDKSRPAPRTGKGK
jgi:hypothetical protein